MPARSTLATTPEGARHTTAPRASARLELNEFYPGRVFRRVTAVHSIERVINMINPVLRGWVNYFAIGHSSECFSFIKDWVAKKVRRQLAFASEAKGLRLGTME